VGALSHATTGVGPPLREEAFSAGDVLMREGDFATHFRMIKLGTVFMSRTGSEGALRPVAIGGRGDVFGLCGFLKQPNQVSAVAGSSGRFCEISIESVSTLARKDPAFRDRLGLAYSDNFGLVARWAEALGRRTVVAQVGAGMRLLAQDQHNTLVDIPSHTALARLFGTTRETVARSIGTLETQGCVMRRSARRCEVNLPRLGEWLASHP